VTECRTKQDYAHQMKYLLDERYPDAEWITVVHDQLKLEILETGLSWQQIFRIRQIAQAFTS